MLLECFNEKQVFRCMKDRKSQALGLLEQKLVLFAIRQRFPNGASRRTGASFESKGITSLHL